MAGKSIPGPMCQIRNNVELDAGTLCRNASPVPGPIAAGPVECAPLDTTAAVSSPTAKTNSKPLGWLSERYEVGKGGGPGTISTGKGDKGGVSYGTYQMSSKVKTVQAFVNRFYSNEFTGLTPGSKEFNAKWAKLARDNPQTFNSRQHDFIQQTHFDPVVARAKKDLGLDLDQRSEGAPKRGLVHFGAARTQRWREHDSKSRRQLEFVPNAFDRC